MFLKQKSTGDLVEILTLEQAYEPSWNKVEGRVHAGEEMQDAQEFEKSSLVFPSGEALPECWTNAEYNGATESNN
ncbi:MAG: acetyltransferase [Jaaginema sp. PMC 1079.18]|nr:acetyltransferase [Jaaginema sp. PMC 1080.18]MEC4850646.1 acetyltransferase [Jaaginema sp. PMC 1079.18]MEC4867792.1 acetyltransferase [Jaaginema sp. PMC 1078.18]